MKLGQFGWNDHIGSLFCPFQNQNLIPARVIRVDRGLATIRTESGTESAVTAGCLDQSGEPGPIAVGDWIVADPTGDTHVIRCILPRTAVLTRRRPGVSDHEQVVAANVDLVLIVESLERGPNPRRIERAAALAWDGGAQPLVVLTKADLCPELQQSVAKASKGAPYCEVLSVSAISGAGMDELKHQLQSGSTAVLLGPSGVGKSTLTNHFLGEEKFTVAAVRESDSKGKHTTTFRELVALPGGACLIDTPGVRELGLWLSVEAVSAAFPEIEEAAQRCRFSDCRHETEPECAVLVEVERGSIESDRLASFLRLRKETENLEMRRDVARRHELRAKERSFGKMARQVLKRKLHH